MPCPAGIVLRGGPRLSGNPFSDEVAAKQYQRNARDLPGVVAEPYAYERAKSEPELAGHKGHKGDRDDDGHDRQAGQPRG